MNLDQRLTLVQCAGILGALTVYLAVGALIATTARSRGLRPLGGSIQLSMFLVTELWPAFLLVLAFLVLVVDPIRDRRG